MEKVTDDNKKFSAFERDHANSKLGKGLGCAQFIRKQSGSGSDASTISINSDSCEDITCGEELFMDLCTQWIASNGDRILDRVLTQNNKKKPVLKK